ncbi:MAG: hypothetical protein AB2421_00060 [Thermotaleaceae bacterium]
MKNKILEKLKMSSLEEILDIDNFEELQWIWVNREVFLDIVLNLKLDELLGEDVLDEIHKIEDEEILRALILPFEKKGYLPMNQLLFGSMEEGFKPTEDIKTIVFVKESKYKKISIHMVRRYEWLLTAMAMDTYFRMGLDYKSLKEAYEDLYEGNSRLIEDLLTEGEVAYLAGSWKYIRKTDELYFYKGSEFYNSWTEGETRSKFQELLKR